MKWLNSDPSFSHELEDVEQVQVIGCEICIWASFMLLVLVAIC